MFRNRDSLVYEDCGKVVMVGTGPKPNEQSSAEAKEKPEEETLRDKAKLEGCVVACVCAVCVCVWGG